MKEKLASAAKTSSLLVRVPTSNTAVIFIRSVHSIDVPQAPGAFERMQGIACTRMAAAHLVPGAGHWVQQEQPARTVELLKELLAREA